MHGGGIARIIAVSIGAMSFVAAAAAEANCTAFAVSPPRPRQECGLRIAGVASVQGSFQI